MDTVSDEPVVHRDIAGNQIKLDDFVLYATTQGHSSTLKFGRVSRLADRPSAYVVNSPGKMFPTLRLITVSRHWNGTWHLQKNGREVTVDRLEQVMIVPRASVPPDVLALLGKEEDYVPFG